MSTTYERRIAALADALRDERDAAAPNADRIAAIKADQARVQAGYDAAWRTAHAAAAPEISLDANGCIYATTYAMGGGRSRLYARPGDPGYDHAKAAILAHRAEQAAAGRAATAAALAHLGLPTGTPVQVRLLGHYAMIHPHGSQAMGVRVDFPGLTCRTIEYPGGRR